jgi:hypothetical protein
MFSGITVAAIVEQATTFASQISNVLLIVVGFGVMLTLANWVIRKLR